MAISRFFKIPAAAILDFRNFEFLTVGPVKSVELVIMLNFVEIARTSAEIWPFFQDGGPAIFDLENFNGRNGIASWCQISSKLLEPRSRYGDF